MKIKLFIIAIISFNSFTSLFATEMGSIKKLKDNNASLLNLPSKKTSDLYLISSLHINRIITPFSQPSLKIDSISDIKYKTSGNVIYIATPKSMQGKILAGFITEKDNESNAIRFIFRAEPMPPQEIKLKDNLFFLSSPNLIAQKFESSLPRQNIIINVLKKLAFQGLPEGYAILPPSSEYFPDCKQKGLEFDFFRGQLISGGDYMIAVGVAKNITDELIEFYENNCYSESIVAVSAYPKTKLLSNQATEVFVMFYRKSYFKENKARQSLIKG